MNFENFFIKYIDNDTTKTSIVLLIFLVGLFFMLKKSSFVFVNTDKKVKIELYDCLDSIEDFSLNELTYSPKPPKYLVIHCTGSIKDQTKEDLWKVFRERWGLNAKPGYNYAVGFKGNLITFSPINSDTILSSSEMVNGVYGYNSVSMHIAVVGGYKENSLTLSQLAALDYLCQKFRKQFPNIIVIGHRELASKDKDQNGIITPNEWVKPCPRMKVQYVF